jgi:hypothetical protein
MIKFEYPLIILILSSHNYLTYLLKVLIRVFNKWMFVLNNNYIYYVKTAE